MTRLAAAGRRPPAGHWPIDARWPHATIAGCSLACAHCGATSTAPLPRDVAAYNQAAETFLREHKHCQEAA